MNKKLVRIVAALLVAMLALTLIPLGAFAADDGATDGSGSVGVPAGSSFFNGTHIYDKKNPTFADNAIATWGDFRPLNPGDKLKTDDWETLIDDGEDIYEFRGFASNGEFIKKINTWMIDRNMSGKGFTAEELKKAAEQYRKETNITFKYSDIKIPNIPTDPEKFDDWFYKYGELFAGYTPHKHKLSRWYSDGTTHWRECLVCKNYSQYDIDFMDQNWCQDGDEDGICNVCGGDVPYHDITVEAPDGYTVTLNRDNASHRMKITAKVDAPAGAQYKLHFIKVRPDGSEQEITRHKENGEFYTKMPTYPMKVVIEPIQ